MIRMDPARWRRIRTIVDDALDRPEQREGRSPVVMSEAPVATTEVRAVDTVQLPPYTVLEIATGRSRYRVVVVTPLMAEVTVEGGSRFPDPTHATLLDGDIIETGRPVAFWVDGRRVTTTIVERITLTPATT